jgi:site-specific DNA-methyltransferase (adenine-specific)
MSDYRLYVGDCLEILPTLTGINAVVTDPPYGIDAGNMNLGKWRTFRMEKSDWDKGQIDLLPLLNLDVPTVFWGGNYFHLPQSRCWFIWDKGAGFKGRDFSECELAWTNLDAVTRIFTYDPLAHGDYKTKQHPTQKPAALIVWVLVNSTAPGDTVLDPFMGSGTTGVACAKTGRNFIGIEIDEGYYKIAEKRIREAHMQLPLLEVTA